MPSLVLPGIPAWIRDCKVLFAELPIFASAQQLDPYPDPCRLTHTLTHTVKTGLTVIWWWNSMNG